MGKATHTNESGLLSKWHTTHTHHAQDLVVVSHVLGHLSNRLWGHGDEKAGHVDHTCLLHEVPVLPGKLSL